MNLLTPAACIGVGAENVVIFYSLCILPSAFFFTKLKNSLLNECSQKEFCSELQYFPALK